MILEKEIWLVAQARVGEENFQYTNLTNLLPRVASRFKIQHLSTGTQAPVPSSPKGELFVVYLAPVHDRWHYRVVYGYTRARGTRFLLFQREQDRVH